MWTRCVSVLALAVTVTSCGRDGGATVDAPRDDASSLDGTQFDALVIDAAVCAGGGLMTCGAACIDTSWDPTHCGDCSTACSGQASSCAGGQCVAPLSTRWARHFGGTDAWNAISGVAVDELGNTYVAGTFMSSINLGGGPLNSAGSSDIVIASFAPNGAHRWSKRLGGLGDDGAAALAVRHGNVYVVGVVSATVDLGTGPVVAQGTDAFIVRLSGADGTIRAARTFGTPARDAAYALTVDDAGNFTVGGAFGRGTIDFGNAHTLTGDAFANAYTASFTPAGACQWARRMSGAGSDLSQMVSLTADTAGNVTGAGLFYGAADFGSGMVWSTRSTTADAFVASYSSNGAYRWSRTFGAEGHDSAEAVTAAGDTIIVGGEFAGTVNFGPVTLTGSGGDGLVAVLDASTGVTRSVRQLGVAGSYVRAMAITSSGDPIVAAYASGPVDLGTGPLGSDRYDILLAGFERATGTPMFARRYGGAGRDEALAVAATPGDSMVVGGSFEGTADLGLGPVTNGASIHGFAMLVAR